MLSFFNTFAFLMMVFSGATVLQAQEYSNASFIVQDPVITVEGGSFSSNGFEYFSSTGQTIGGESTNASFIQRSGFLFFPVATSPVISATAGNGQVGLSWSASSATLANITNYELGTATISGGPYTYVTLGNILSTTKTGLTNATTYYFKIRAYAGTLRLADSGEVSAVPTAPVTPPLPPPPGGGGSGGGATSTGVGFSGRAYPLSKVTVLKDGQVAITTIAGPDANFNVYLTGLSAGSYTFSVFGEDSKGARSSLFTFPITITGGATTNIGGIFIAPTISVDKSEVKKGDDIIIFGQSAPTAEITINVNSAEPFFVKTNTDKHGVYLYNFDTSLLEYGQHSAKSKTAILGMASSYGKSVGFAVGSKTVFAKLAKASAKGDLNGDKKVNLVDFSIAAYWYKRPLNTDFKLIEIERLNGDDTVDLIDVSIMAFYWTG